MQIGVFAEIGRGELVQFTITVELEVGLLRRREESVGREEPWIPQGPLARERRDVSRERRRRLLRERTRLRLVVVGVVVLGRVVYAAAHWHARSKHARRAGQSCDVVSEAWTA